ncbi:MAG TPA: response regulator transcription factor [Bacillota bacterium]|nr:response regulator transcription factor [Bacillota bacterium]
MKKILLVEDEENILFAVKRYLENAGYAVFPASTLSEARASLHDDLDLILLDLNLPDGDGFAFLDLVRENSSIPIICLTVRDSDGDIIRGLDSGADDYITKPFKLPVLKARIETVLRRVKKDPEFQSILQSDGVTLDKNLKKVFIDQREEELSLKEFQLLCLFMENPGRTLTRELIIDIVWGLESDFVYDNTLSVNIRRLRHKLGHYQNKIQTVRGIGYRWIEGEMSR